MFPTACDQSVERGYLHPPVRTSAKWCTTAIQRWINRRSVASPHNLSKHCVVYELALDGEQLSVLSSSPFATWSLVEIIADRWYNRTLGLSNGARRFLKGLIDKGYSPPCTHSCTLIDGEVDSKCVAYQDDLLCKWGTGREILFDIYSSNPMRLLDILP